VSLRPIKLAGRWLQEKLERGIVGTRLQEWVWRTRHLYRRNWAEGYLDTVEHPHRAQIVEAVADFAPIDSILEIGCASGANLVRLRARFTEVRLLGIDINRRAIATADSHFGRQGDSNVSFSVGRADHLDLPDASVDVVLTDAVLMFVAPDRIGKVLNEMCRVARKGLVLIDYHCPGADNGHFKGGRWVYDLVALLRRQLPIAEIKISKSNFSGGAWDQFGTLIEVRLL
jgi:SAM-dependent methyltransferase